MVGLCAAGVGASPGVAPTPAACGKLLPPAGGVYFGLMHPQEWQAPNPPRIESLERATGVTARFATFTIPWGQRLAFPSTGVVTLWRAGFVPMLRLFAFPTYDYGDDALPPSAYPGPYAMSRIASGEYDDQIRTFADAARATDIPILFDIDPEMNNAHPWGGRFDGAGATSFGDPGWPDGPEHFRDGYRRFVDIFRQEGATNVTFFFHPDSVYGYTPGSYTEPFEQFHWYYPGDQYVDWMGLSVYSHPNKPDGSNVSFEEKLETFHGSDYVGSYSELAALGPKPIALSELGFDSLPSEQAKAAWVLDAAAVMQSSRYPRIAAVDWWGDDGTGGYNGDPTTSATLTAAFHAAFAQPHFEATPAFSGNCLPPAPRSVRLAGRTLRWTTLVDAASYQVYRGTKRIATTTATTYVVPKPGAYRVRAVNVVGAGAFTAATR
jgi:Glycosyl hydrolase family 26